MSKASTEFGDPQAVTKLYCDQLLAAVPAAELPDYLEHVLITTRQPSARPAGAVLTVRQQPTWALYRPPVAAAARIRLVAWSLDEDTAWSVASWFHGRLLGPRVANADPQLRAFRYDAGPAKGTDPDYQTPIAAFTVLASMRPAIL